MTGGSIVLAIPGSLTQRTGGYIYDRHLVEGLRQRGWNVEVLEVDPSFPFPTEAALEDVARAIGGIPRETTLIVDSLALGAMPEVIAEHAGRLMIVALMHSPLSAASHFDAETAARFEVSERRALAQAARVVVTGRAAVPLMANLDVPPAKLVVIEPGVDPAPLAHGTDTATVNLLSVGTIASGKGHELLLEALTSVAHLDWRLVCAGSLTRWPATVDRVRDAIARYSLGHRVSLVGDLDQARLELCYDRADVFVLATLQETYGMAVAEALAHGLPVVATATGAIPDMVGDTAGIVVPVGDVQLLAYALSRIISDGELRAGLAEGARRVRKALRSWDHTVAQFEAAITSAGAHG